MIYAEVKILGVGIELASLEVICPVAFLLGAYIWEKITEQVRVHILGDSKNRLIKWTADGLAASIYKLPIFWACVFLLMVFGYPISIRKTALLSLIYLGENMLLVGGLSGIVLDWLHYSLPKALNWIRCLLRKFRAWLVLQYNVFPPDR